MRKLNPRVGSFLPAAVAGLSSLVIAYVVLHLWKTSLNVPWTHGGEDTWSVLLYMKATLDHVWPLHNPQLGAPFGQDLQDYPLGDPLQIVLTKLIGVFSGDVAVVTNVFFLLTFPLAAISAVWVFRRLGISTWTAVACAIIFAVAPYHFFHGEDHLLIAAYYTVPLSAYLIVTQLAGELVPVRTTVVLAVLIGLAFTYYVVFTLVLLAFAVVVSLASRNRAAARRGALALGVIAAMLFVAHSPTWIYDLRHGGNPDVSSLHSPDQSESYSLKIPRMVFPVPGDRIKPLANLSARFDDRSPTQLEEGPAQALGLLMTVGFIALLWIGLTAAVRRPAVADRDPYLRASAGATIAALVFGLAGGAALVVAYSISPLLRSWARLSIVIAFLALIAVGKGIDYLGGRLSARGTRPAVLVLALVALVVAASAEQTSSRMVPDYETNAAVWHADAAFATRAADVLPAGSFVAQLPYVPFPEATYTPARPYLHTNRLRWTFGAMRGRAADWMAALVGLPPNAVVASATAAGASAIFVDTQAYPDGGRKTLRALGPLLGRPLATGSGRFVLYDLRPYRARLQARLGAARLAEVRRLTLHPVRVLPGPQLSPPHRSADATPSYLRLSYSHKADLDLVNPLPEPRTVTVRLRVGSLGPPDNFIVSFPGREQARFLANPVAAGQGDVVLKPGHNHVTITDTARAAPFQQTFFSVDAVGVRDRAVEQLIG